MKQAFLWLLTAGILMGQDPFDEKVIPSNKDGDMEYNFADIHKWDDMTVKLDGKADPKIVTWLSTNVASHKGVTGKTQNFSFKMDLKVYEEALRHPELNRGVTLMSGDARFPLLYCWLRPFSTQGGIAFFDVRVPLDRLKEMYIAFSPNAAGNKRYLYNLNDVVIRLKERPSTPRPKDAPR